MSNNTQDRLAFETNRLRAKVEELEKQLLGFGQLEKLVEENEQRFKQILNLTYDGIVIYEKEKGEIIEANLRLIHKLKYKREKVIGKSVFHFITDSQHDIIKQRLTENLPDVYETLIVDNEGKQLEFEICSRSCVYHGRKVKIAAVCDVSYRKKYEKTLKESEERFRSLAENMDDSIILLNETDIIYVNPSTSFVLGTGNNPFDGLLQMSQHVHPDDQQKIDSLINDVNSGQRRITPVQFRILTDDNKERWVWTRVFPVVPDDPNDHRLVILSSDITEMREKEEAQKKIEIAARTAEEKYKVLTSLLPEIIIETEIGRAHV